MFHLSFEVILGLLLVDCQHLVRSDKQELRWIVEVFGVEDLGAPILIVILKALDARATIIEGDDT